MFGWFDSKALLNALTELRAAVNNSTEDVLNSLRRLRAESLQLNNQLSGKVDSLMKSIEDLQGSVSTLTTEVSETKELIKKFRDGNKEQEQMIADLRRDLDTARLDSAQKAELLAGIDELDQAIKDQSAELDAAQKEPTAPNPGETPTPIDTNSPSGGNVTTPIEGRPI